MPADLVIPISSTGWTLLTDSDVTTLRIQNLSQEAQFAATVGAGSEPTAAVSYITFDYLEGDKDFDLAVHFPGIVGANRVWAKSLSGPGRVSVSYA